MPGDASICGFYLPVRAPGGGCVPNDLTWETELWWDARWAKPKNGNGRGRICRRHGLHKASRFSGGITLLMQPLRTGKPCGTRHDAIFIPFRSRFQAESYSETRPT